MISLLFRRSMLGLSLVAALCLALMPAAAMAKGGFSSSDSHSSSRSSSKSSPSGSSGKSSSASRYGSPSQGSASQPSSGSGYGSPSQGSTSKPGSASNYGSPSLSATAPATAGGPVSGLGSANDKAVSQQSSKSSLDAYKASKAPPAPATGNWQPNPGSTWLRPSYVPSTPAYYGSGSSGISGLVWWMMIENLANHAVMATLMSHRDSDDYRAWRRDADRQAADNAELRGRLDEMDRKLAQEGQASALASPPPSESHALRNVLWIVLIGGGLYAAYRVYARRRA